MTNAVTGETWKENETSEGADWAEVKAPEVPGYKVDSAMVRSSELPADYVVPAMVATPEYEGESYYYFYVAKEAHMNVEFYDQSAEKVLSTKSFTGKYETTADFDLKAEIAKYEKQGYEVIGGVPENGLTFTDPDTTTYRIVLKQKTDDNVETKEVTRKINFQYENGAIAKTPITQKVTFVRTNTVNAVTGAIVYGEWEAIGGTKFDEVEVPEIKGYTADTTKIDAVDEVTPETESTNVTVKYTAKDASAKITIVDTENGDVLGEFTVNGKFGSKITSDEATSLLNELKEKGYVVEVNPLDSNIAFNEDGQVQNVTIKLNHGKDTKTETKEITRTFNFVTPEGKVLKTVVQKVVFTKTTTTDLVTGEVTEGDWVSEKPMFDLIKFEVIGGYAPTEPGYLSQEVTVDTENSEYTIRYDKMKETVDPENPNGENAGTNQGSGNNTGAQTGGNNANNKGNTGSKANDNKNSKNDVQTGVPENHSGIFALISASLTAMFGGAFVLTRRKRKEK